MDKRLRDEILHSALIRNEEIQEELLDAIRLTKFVSWEGFEVPPGNLQEGWLVVTELRIIILAKFVHTYQVGNTQCTRTYWRAQAFPFVRIASMLVHELGRAFKSYELELMDEDRTQVKLRLTRPRFFRLFLVANVHQLPLRLKSEGSSIDEYRTALVMSLLPILLWCAPFAISTCCNMVNRHYPLGDYQRVYESLTYGGLTTIAIYLPALLLLVLCLRVHRSWKLAIARHIFGKLPLDFTAGPMGVAPDPNNVPSNEDGNYLFTLPVEPTSPQQEREIPSALPVERRNLGSPELPDSVSGDPLQVEIPTSVRNALGIPESMPPVETPPNLPRVSPLRKPGEKMMTVPCPHCGSKYSLPLGTRGKALCKKCGKKFRIEL